MRRLRQGSVALVIIWPRDSDIVARSESTIATDSSRRGSGGRRCLGSGVWTGLSRAPRAGGHQPECLRIGDRESLHRRAAEERQDNSDFRSADALDLRELPIPASGLDAVLVSEPAHRPADRHLTVQRSALRIHLKFSAQWQHANGHPAPGQVHERECDVSPRTEDRVISRPR